MFRGQKWPISGTASLKQLAEQFRIHTQVRSVNIDRMLCISCMRFIDRAHVMSVRRLFVHSSLIRSPFLSGIHGSDGLTAQLVGCPGPRGGPLGRCLVRIASVECCPVVCSGRCVPSVRRGSRLPLHYRRATSASAVPYPIVP